jgi:hypothetical protein
MGQLLTPSTERSTAKPNNAEILAAGWHPDGQRLQNMARLTISSYACEGKTSEVKCPTLVDKSHEYELY